MSDDRVAFLVSEAFRSSGAPDWLGRFAPSLAPHHYPLTRGASSEDLVLTCRACPASWRFPVFAEPDELARGELAAHALTHSETAEEVARLALAVRDGQDDRPVAPHVVDDGVGEARELELAKHDAPVAGDDAPALRVLANEPEGAP